MGACATKPKTNGDEGKTPLPAPIEESVKTTTGEAEVVAEVKVELEEKKTEDQIDEKKVDDGEKKVEEDNQQHSLGSLLNGNEATGDKKEVDQVPTEAKSEEKPKEEVKVMEAESVEAPATAAMPEVVVVEKTEDEAAKTVEAPATTNMPEVADGEKTKDEAAKLAEPPVVVATPVVVEAQKTDGEAAVSTTVVEENKH